MAKNHKTVKEILAYIKQDKPGYIRLMDGEQNTLVPYNTKKGATADTLKQIEKILNSPNESLHPDGIYFLSIKNTQVGKHTLHRIAKGNVKEEIAAPATVVIAPKTDISEASNSATKLLEMQLQQLKTENELLKEQLEQDLEEEEEEVRLSEERIDKWIDRAEKVVLPALDKFFELQEKKISIREKELSAKAPAAQTVAFNPKANKAATIIRRFTRQPPDTIQPPPTQAPAQPQAPAAAQPDQPGQDQEEMTPEEMDVMYKLQAATQAQIIEALQQLKATPEQYAEFVNTVLMFRDDAGEILVSI